MSDGNGNNQKILASIEQYNIVLPCDVHNFRNFVSGLLGKPQELKGTITGFFEITNKDISNIYHLIHQRVTQQNISSLILYTIKILYDDGTSVTHNNIDSFESYYPISKTYPHEIVISFTYLITFQNTSAPEKQEIEVLISTKKETLNDNETWLDTGLFEYDIKHTNRTWASDIANVLTTHAKTFMDSHAPIWRFISRYHDEFFDITSYIVLFSFITICFFDFKNTYFIDEAPLYTKFFIKDFVRGSYILFVLYLFLKVLERVAIYTYFVRKESFINLVDRDFENMKLKKKKNIKTVFLYFLSWLANISAGIIATLVYNHSLI